MENKIQLQHTLVEVKKCNLFMEKNITSSVTYFVVTVKKKNHAAILQHAMAIEVPLLTNLK
jgi:hypothetical protein